MRRHARGWGSFLCRLRRSRDGDATAPFRSARTRPTVVSVLAVLKILAGAGWSVMAGLCAISSSLPQRASPVFAAGAVVLFGLSVVCFACAYGLWTLKPFGRVLQIVLCVGIVIGFPVGSVDQRPHPRLHVHPGIEILFSGRAPKRSARKSSRISVRLRDPARGGARGHGGRVAVLMIPMAGIIAAIAIPNFLNAVDRGKQKRTMADARSIAVAMEAYAGEHDGYPVADSTEALGAQLRAEYLPRMPMVDGWTHPSAGRLERIQLHALFVRKDGVGSSCEPAATVRSNDEICLIDGQFVRYPTGLQQ